jgi:putative SOS response-associated peptidase YedK
VDGFFEWKATKRQKAKQPYAIAMKDGAPFGLAGIWENWKTPSWRVDSDLCNYHNQSQ